MKTHISIVILVSAVAIYAGTVCFDIPAGSTPRVAEAFGNALSLVDASGSPRPATQQEVSQACQNYVQNTTQDYERRKNMASFAPSPVPIATAVPSPTAVGLKKK
jgi:hypothetical protein